MPAFFLILSYSFFIVITWRALKGYYTGKRLKVDYSKNICTEENSGHGFVCLLVSYTSVKNNYWKLQFCWCRSSECSKSSQYLAQLWPQFYRYLESVKKVNYIYWKRLVLVHLKRYYENVYIIALSCLLTYFHFAWKGTLRS